MSAAMPSVFKTPAGEQTVKDRYARFLAYWPKPAEQRRIETPLGETFVIVGGPEGAPAVLLLHGSAANSGSWLMEAQRLAQSFRVYGVDMVGEPGFSAPSRPPLASGVYAAWLDEVMTGLGLERASLVGISLGGWLALEYATKHPEKVQSLVLLCPGGVGKHRNVLLWVAPLMLLGPWGRRMALARILGRAPAGEPSSAAKAFGEFMQLVFSQFRPRTERLPRFDDAALARLTMPVLAILGGKDAMIDSAGTRERLTAHVPNAEVVWLPKAGHLLSGHAETIERFLKRAIAP